ncbi:MAG: shikimate kinase, partial [Clostridia bacterium]|nr:shikimate kinase [Clostridia bacterium]
LDVSLSEIKKRIKNMATRGISMREGQTFEDLYYERNTLYNKYCDVKIDCTKSSLSKNAFKIAEALGLVSH